jgi:hypothetical protein
MHREVRCGRPLPPSVPCPGAPQLFAAKSAAVSGSVDGAAHNLAVEATSTGWPHRASCSFLPCAASRQLRLTFTLCARIRCVSFDGASCAARRLRWLSKYPRRISVSACIAIGLRLKFTVAVAMRHRVFHPGSAVASTVRHRCRARLPRRASHQVQSPRRGNRIAVHPLWLSHDA